jgi:peptidyl-Lys metalloendopeptidase
MTREFRRRVVAVIVLVVALLMAATAGAGSQRGPNVELSVASGELLASDAVLVKVTVSNPTKHTIHVLSWLTGEEGLDAPIFRVTRDGSPVAYTGPIVKRARATADDYVALKAGEQRSRVVDLGDAYDLTQSGNYEIAYDVSSADLFEGKSSADAPDSLTSAPVSVTVEGRAPKGKPPGGGGGTPGFTACSTTQQSQLTTARANASSYAQNASAYLNAGTVGPRYTTWFGVFASQRYNQVSSNFVKISSAFASANITYDCSSKRNVYAFVYPSQPYKIYLGRVYWTAPATGTDSQAGTLIHEMSHFTVVAGTDDLAYGQTAAKALATSDPDSAIRNADSHEYFAENTPFQN